MNSCNVLFSLSYYFFQHHFEDIASLLKLVVEACCWNLLNEANYCGSVEEKSRLYSVWPELGKFVLHWEFEAFHLQPCQTLLYCPSFYDFLMFIRCLVAKIYANECEYSLYVNNFGLLAHWLFYSPSNSVNCNPVFFLQYFTVFWGTWGNPFFRG